MRVEKNHPQMEKVVDPSRPYIGQPYLDTENAALVATNGLVLARVPVVVEEQDVAGYVPVEALKAAAKNGGKLDLLERYAIASGVRFDRLVGETFPNYQQVIPQETAHYTVGLDAKLLWALAQAMGSKGQVMLQFQEDPLSPVRVYAEPADGVIMPCRLD